MQVWSKYEHFPGWPAGNPANASALLTRTDAETQFVLPYEAGADGLVCVLGHEHARIKYVGKYQSCMFSGVVRK